jgi:hypothetical protein
LNFSQNIRRMIKLKWMRWAGHAARMGAMRNSFTILVDKPEGTRPLERPRRKWADSITIDLKEIGFEGVDWIHLDQDMIQWRAVMDTVIDVRDSRGIS